MVKNIVTAGVILFYTNIANANVVKGEGEYRFGPDTPENLACNIA